MALVGGLSWPCAGFCPLPHNTVLLAKSGFVLEPDLNRGVGRKMVQVGVQRGDEVFLNAVIVSAS